MSTTELDSLINNLSEEREAVKPMTHPLKRLIPVLVFMAIYFSAATYFLGLRMGLEEKLMDTYFLFETLTMLAVALSASFASSWLTVPDMRGKSWMLAIAPCFLGLFILWSVIRSITEGMGFGVKEIDWGGCVMDAAIMGFVPGLIMILFAKAGATTRPLMTGFMNILTITGFSYVGLRMTCEMENVGHGIIVHLMPFIAAGVIVALLARRLFRW